MSVRHIIMAVLVATTVTAGTAAAQPVGVGPGVAVGVGVGTGPFFGPRVWPWYGPGLWGWGPGWWGPGWGPGWGRGVGVGVGVGVSAAGPIGWRGPSFPPVPATFGTADPRSRLFNGPPGLYDPYLWSPPLVTGPAKDLPLAILPPGYNGPRFATRDVRRRFAEQKADPMVGIERAYQDLARGTGTRLIQPCLRLRVLVPADAQVWIQDQPMTATGTDRLFESPPLTPGVEYTYTVTAKLPGGRTETKSVAGKPGETVAVVFEK